MASRFVWDHKWQIQKWQPIVLSSECSSQAANSLTQLNRHIFIEHLLCCSIRTGIGGTGKNVRSNDLSWSIEDETYIFLFLHLFALMNKDLLKWAFPQVLIMTMASILDYTSLHVPTVCLYNLLLFQHTLKSKQYCYSLKKINSHPPKRIFFLLPTSNILSIKCIYVRNLKRDKSLFSKISEN